MPQFIATFGYAFKELRDRFVRVYAADEDEARCKMYEKYGNRWSRIYTSEKEAGVGKFKLELLEEIH